jgi:hypothetical protein
MENWRTIDFAEGESYKLHTQDELLFANTGIGELIQASLRHAETIYIPKYVYVFKVFMHCLRGYDVDVHYLSGICRTKNIYVKNMIQMLVVDNIVYKVPQMAIILENLSYVVCPKTLSNEQLAHVYMGKSADYKLANEEIYKQICDLIDDQPPPLHTPYKQLQKYYNNAVEDKRFEEFKTEVNVKLPYMLIEIVKLVSVSMERPISPNFEYNIKQRVRDDPDLAKELYEKLTQSNILSFVSVCMSCISAFIDFFVKKN